MHNGISKPHGTISKTDDRYVPISIFRSILQEISLVINQPLNKIDLEYDLDSIEIAQILSTCGALKTQDINILEIKKVKDIFHLLANIPYGAKRVL